MSQMPAGGRTRQPSKAGKGTGPISKVWMLSYECAGIAQAGGLGEAVAGLARTLAKDSNLTVTVLLPSHGRHLDPDLRAEYNLKEEATFIANGHRTGENGVRYPYLAGVERGLRDSVRYVLVKGFDGPTSRWLDDTTLYDHDIMFEKMSLFARTVKTYSDYLLATGLRSELPDLIHAHDWHMVPAGVSLKQTLDNNRTSVPLVFTIHLLGHVSLPWHYASEAWCGIKDTQHRVRIGRKKISTLGNRQVWREFCNDSLERFGCYEAGYVTSVSDSYLKNDVYDYVGNVITGKSGHIYNGCDWDYDQISSVAQPGENGGTVLVPKNIQLSRWDLRKYLLTQGLAQARPVSEQENRLDEPQDQREGDERLVEPFSQDGPLVLMTGRMSPQKGVDILLDAVPSVLKAIPNTRFLLFLLPSGDSDLVTETKRIATNYPENVRLILGRHRPIYLQSHIAADVYAMPSRSEPFGISALEAMVTGNPVVGADIGGIRETVLDIAKYGNGGTGVLVPPEDANSLATALVSIIMVMKIDEFSQRRLLGNNHPTQEIPSKPIKKLAGEDPLLGSKIRINCRTRVEEKFRWKNAGLMALARYREAQRLAMEAAVDSKPSGVGANASSNASPRSSPVVVNRSGRGYPALRRSWVQSYPAPIG